MNKLNNLLKHQPMLIPIEIWQDNLVRFTHTFQSKIFNVNKTWQLNLRFPF